jgi:GTPase SAR1 family protein
MLSIAHNIDHCFLDAMVALCIYDVSDQGSFESLKHWIQELWDKGDPATSDSFLASK